MSELKQIYQRFFSMGIMIFVIISSILLSQDPPEAGCTDVAACNYDPSATIDNRCDGNVLDCADECGGTSELDCAGQCNGTSELDTEGTCCDPLAMDCADVCFGDAVHDACDVCEGNGATNGLCTPFTITILNTII
jgi:hypothetical protein